jgi:hypothetical protein
MVNQKFLDNINLATSPWGQKFMGHATIFPKVNLSYLP